MANRSFNSAVVAEACKNEIQNLLDLQKADIENFLLRIADRTRDKITVETILRWETDSFDFFEKAVAVRYRSILERTNTKLLKIRYILALALPTEGADFLINLSDEEFDLIKNSY